jgi:hypothetical protein
VSPGPELVLAQGAHSDGYFFIRAEINNGIQLFKFETLRVGLADFFLGDLNFRKVKSANVVKQGLGHEDKIQAVVEGESDA